MGRVVAIVIGILIFLMILGKCSGSTDQPNVDYSRDIPNAETAEPISPTLPPTSKGEPISVPSDPRAAYQLVEWRALPNGNREAITRRDGPSGTSFARREIDCLGMQFRYLGEGDSLEEARIDRPATPSPMGDLTPESISTYVSEFVCGK